MTNKDIENLGYNMPTYVEGVGWCGICRFIYTAGVVYGIDMIGYEGRYCFKYYSDAIEALRDFKNIANNENWIKHKGVTEYSNPLYVE